MKEKPIKTVLQWQTLFKQTDNKYNKIFTELSEIFKQIIIMIIKWIL